MSRHTNRITAPRFFLILTGTTLATGCSVTTRGDEIETDDISQATTHSEDDTGQQHPTGSSTDYDAPRIDVGGGEPRGCQKVDFLFVFDDSASELAHQEQVIAAFPGFIEAIDSVVAGYDHHILVTSSSQNSAWACQDGPNYGSFPEFTEKEGGIPWDTCLEHPEGTVLPAESHIDGTPSPCGGYTCGAIDTEDQCKFILGAGETAPIGGNATNHPCEFESERRYLTREDRHHLTERFACAATVGTSGSWAERPFSAAAAAVSPELTQAGGCNEGFVRDDAILVVTLVTNDSILGQEHPGDIELGEPTEWYNALLEAKGGDAQAIVVLGFIIRPQISDHDCSYGYPGAPRFSEFISYFGERGFQKSACAPDYTESFSEAIEIIDSTCQAFVP